MSQPPILCYVTDRLSLAGGEDALPAAIQSAVEARIDWIQIREKTLPTRRLLDIARAAVQLARDKVRAAPPQPASAPRIILNDRLDVALAARAGGVHLGASSLPIADVRRFLSDFESRAVNSSSGSSHRSANFLLGRSCHSLLEAQQAEGDGAGYVILGPIFSTPSKAQFGDPLGLTRLEATCRALRIPVLAIGGITVGNAADCVRAGAAGVAAIRLFQQSPNLPEVVAELKKM